MKLSIVAATRNASRQTGSTVHKTSDVCSRWPSDDLLIWSHS